MIVDRFRAAWRKGDAPRIDDFLPGESTAVDDRQRRELLLELVMVDLEFRWQRDETFSPHATAGQNADVAREGPRLIEDYVQRYPHWMSLSDLPLELIGHEYRVRHVWGDQPEQQEYERRFPGLASQLLPRLSQLRTQLGEEQTLDLTARSLKLAKAPAPGSARIVGDFELLEEIGRGGMGVVYRARQISLNRVVALKMIKSGGLADAEEVQRFQLEAQAAARLDHPAIIPVYEVGQVDQQHYYAMGLVEGRSLAQQLNSGPLAPRPAAALLLIIAEAIHHAHSQGVIHRDLKPANVLLVQRKADSAQGGSSSTIGAYSSTTRAAQDELTDQLSLFPRIADFGLAKQMQSGSDLTSTGQIIGTPSYMPPEQARGDSRIGPGADIYSLGAMLYAMLCGRPPFQAASVIDTVQQVIHQEPLPPRRLNPAIDRDIETICLKCLQKSTESRYDTAWSLVEDLRRYLRFEPIIARPIGAASRLWRWCRRKPAVAGLVVSALATTLAGLALLVIGGQLSAARQREQAAHERQQADQERLQAAESLSQARAIKIQATQQLADTQRYYALLNGVRKRNAEPKAGWTKQSLDELTQAATLALPADAGELRNEAARCLTGFDLRKRHEFPVLPGYRSHLLAFDPTGAKVATAVLKHAAVLIIDVYDVSRGTKLHTLTTTSDIGWQFTNRNQDGIEAVGFVGQGSAVAIVTRSGSVRRWDLSTAPPTSTSFRWPFKDFAPQQVAGLEFDPQGDRLWIASEKGLYAWSYRDMPATESSIGKVDDRRTRTIAMTPDGGRLIASIDDNLYVFATAPPCLLKRLPLSTRNCSIDRSGRTAAALMGEAIAIIDLESGHVIRTLVNPESGQLHDGGLRLVRLSPTGSLLVTGGSDGRIMVWDTLSGQFLMSDFIGGTDSITPAFSPDERYLATTGNSRVKFFELNRPNTLRSVAIQPHPVRTFDLALEVPLLVTAALADNTRHLAAWDIDHGERLARWQISGAESVDSQVVLSRGGQRLAVNDPRMHRTFVWELSPTVGRRRIDSKETLESSAPRSSLVFHDDRYRCVAREGPLDATAPTSSAPLTELGTNWSGVDAALNWSPDRWYLFRGDECLAIDTATNRPLAGFPQKITAHFPGLWEAGIDAACSLPGNRCGFFRGDEWIRYDVGERRVEPGFPRKIVDDWPGVPASDLDAAWDYSELDGAVWFVQRDKAWKYLLHEGRSAERPIALAELLGESAAELRVTALVDTGAGRGPSPMIQRWHRLGMQEPISVGFSGDGTTMVSGEQGKDLVARSTSDGAVRWQFSNEEQRALIGVSGFQCLAVGKNSVVAGADQVGRLFALDDGRSQGMFFLEQRVSSLALAPDASFVVVGTTGGGVLVVTLPAAAVHAQRKAHQDQVTSVALAASGELLVTASKDRTVVLWQRRVPGMDFEPVVTLPSPSGAVRTVRFSADGHRLLANVQGENGVRIWDLDRLRSGLREMKLDWSAGR